MITSISYSYIELVIYIFIIEYLRETFKHLSRNEILPLGYIYLVSLGTVDSKKKITNKQTQNWWSRRCLNLVKMLNYSKKMLRVQFVTLVCNCPVYIMWTLIFKESRTRAQIGILSLEKYLKRTTTKFSATICISTAKNARI